MSSNCDGDFGSQTNMDINKVQKRTSIEEALRCPPIDVNIDRVEEERLFGKVFSIPLLLKEILKNLERPDLLKTSLVNKYWSFFSREVLRESKRCLAAVKPHNFCHDLKRLNSLLLKSKTVPFSGLSIFVGWTHDDHDCRLSFGSPDLWSNILSKIDIKYLSLDCHHQLGCISLECVREILTKKGNSLEGLRLYTTPRYISPNFGFCKLIGLDLKGHWLPNLRFLEFPFPLKENSTNKYFLKGLVGAAPKLKEIRGNVNQECLEFILPLKLASAVKEFDLMPTLSSLRHCLAFSLENTKLTKFRFSTCVKFDDREIMFSRWSESDRNDLATIVKQILESSKESLAKIGLDLFDLILMTTNWNIPILQSVSHLSLRYCDDVDIAEGYNMLGKIDWAKYFPNLQEVLITYHVFEDLERDAYFHNDFWEKNEHFICDTVKTFQLAKATYLRIPERMQMFQKIFPNVTELHLKDYKQIPSYLEELWTAWRDLEAIYVWVYTDRGIMRTTPSCRNFDSAFLGVTREEADYLLGNVKQLESLEIVPIKPNIFNLQKLKRIEIRVFHDGSYCFGNPLITSDSNFLTRLVCQCGFLRLPGLSVEIYRHLCEATDKCYVAWKHLEPFVNFVESDSPWAHDFEMF